MVTKKERVEKMELLLEEKGTKRKKQKEKKKKEVQSRVLVHGRTSLGKRFTIFWREKEREKGRRD